MTTLDGFMELNEIAHKKTANRIAEWKDIGDPDAVFKVGEPGYQEEYGLWKGLEELFCVRKTNKGYDPRDGRTITSAEVEAIIKAWNTNDNTTDVRVIGLDLSGAEPSPLDILQKARDEWIEQSSELLTLVIQETESTSSCGLHRSHMLIVHAKHVPSNRTLTLFSVAHRPGAPYPATIQPRDFELPDILKKSYYQPGIAEAPAGAHGAGGREVTNEWICDTPAEFRSKLENVFNLGALKSEVLNLVSQEVSSAETGRERVRR